MKNILIIISLIGICTLLSFTHNLGNEKTINSNDNWNKIDSIFRSFEIDSTGQLNFSFEYKIANEPDVDVFDPNYNMILGEISKEQIIKLVSYYIEICGKKNKTITTKEISNFLTDNTYSIQLDYKLENNKTRNIVCLVYDREKYIFFSIGIK